MTPNNIRINRNAVNGTVRLSFLFADRWEAISTCGLKCYDLVHLCGRPTIILLYHALSLIMGPDEGTKRGLGRIE